LTIQARKALYTIHSSTLLHITASNNNNSINYNSNKTQKMSVDAPTTTNPVTVNGGGESKTARKKREKAEAAAAAAVAATQLDNSEEGTKTPVEDGNGDAFSSSYESPVVKELQK
jgi:hypothetical protein